MIRPRFSLMPVLIAALYAAPGVAHATDAPKIAPGDTLLTLSAEGKSTRAPDIASISAGVATTARTAATASVERGVTRTGAPFIVFEACARRARRRARSNAPRRAPSSVPPPCASTGRRSWWSGRTSRAGRVRGLPLSAHPETALAIAQRWAASTAQSTRDRRGRRAWGLGGTRLLRAPPRISASFPA